MTAHLALSILTVLAVAVRAAADDDCTSTLRITQTMFATPPYWPQCVFDPTMRWYPATETATTAVDCGGCAHLRVRTVPVVYCPFMHATAETTETTPRAVHETVCLPTPLETSTDFLQGCILTQISKPTPTATETTCPSLPSYPHTYRYTCTFDPTNKMRFTTRALALLTAAGSTVLAKPIADDTAKGPPQCTMMVPTFAPFDVSPTQRVWTTTDTVTSAVECGHCTAAQFQYMDGHGPVVFRTTTVTEATPTTVITLVCSIDS
ncbi:hypothetical protein CCM_05678 [Cordyceps militaris CM01]|uniref:Uncharacterized protein n=1 Tax=Cordyceps militaris (strain CM01) TaxID=983644 RepID=G3JGW4_CORMM|nr:uncharacterized protein CCM_05678 [Cordyceps militaris CM01]EGX91520.1 hypothetical protein CCM_05678 [Cordyceps militaris CM01]